MLGNAATQPPNFRAKNWVEMNDDARGNYNIYSQISKTTMLKLSLCDHSDNYIIIKKTITVVEEGADLALYLSDRHNKQVVFD